MTAEFPTLTLDEILNGRKRAQKSIPICMRLDVMAEIEELERQITAAQGTVLDDADQRLAADGADIPGMVEKIRELEAIGRQYTIDVRIQALDKKRWNDKVAEHTIEDDEGNKKLDISALTFDIFADILVSPAMDTDQQNTFLTGLSDGQWEVVMNSVFELNRRVVSVGKSLTASLATQKKSEKRGPDGQ